MKKILVLGYKGMLGNAVCKYFDEKKDDYEISTTNKRWGDESFVSEIKKTPADFIINCIGLIPQKKPTDNEYKIINVDLPIFLDTLGKKIIHPSTDCEFLGNITNTQKYKKTDQRNAEDVYGKSKADVSSWIENNAKNTKIIRTSIIGHENNSHIALLDWFLNSEIEVKGYTNHYWNGVTTLQWAKLCEELINSWENYPVLNQYGTEENKNKYELLNIVKEVYGKTINIIPFESPTTVNKCLESDKIIPTIQTQLQELKTFYNK